MNPTVPETGKKTLIMAILNMTPDSFSGSHVMPAPEDAVDYVKKCIPAGADIIDIGGESTRPGAEPVDPGTEWARIGPVLDALRDVDVPVSVDTYHSDTARRAIACGAAMINDISALRLDPRLVEVVAAANCPYILMHMQGTPQAMQREPRYQDVVGDICAFFEERIAFAVREGIREENIWLDPGFGFGKAPRHNLELLRRLAHFKKFGRPLLIGTSNKGTIGAVLGTEVHDRLEGTAATVAIAIWNGADAVRVHNVKAMARVARMTDAVRRGTW